MKTLLILAAFGAAASAAPAQQIEPGRNRVDYSDLDLASEAGIRSLDGRIRHAASSACGTASPADPAGKRNLKRCRADARASVSQQRAAAIAAARQAPSDRLASRR